MNDHNVANARRDAVVIVLEAHWDDTSSKTSPGHWQIWYNAARRLSVKRMLADVTLALRLAIANHLPDWFRSPRNKKM